MTDTIITIYLAVSMCAAAVVYVVSGKADDRRPVTVRIPLSLLAGLVWPLLLLGAVEYTGVAAYAKVHEDDDANEGIDVLV